jgi:predicted Zn-dependent peptidase
MLSIAENPYNFKKKKINGMTVYYNHLPWSPCTHIAMGFRVGSLHDPIKKEGLAHFLEHCSFNGCPSMPTPKDVREFKKKYTLDSMNARTGYWFTEYTARCLPKNFNKTIEGMQDMIFNSFLEDKWVEHERRVITQEIWDRHRNKKKDKYLRKYLKTVRPGLLAERMWTALGWPETVAKITQTDLKNLQQSHYRTGNMYVILVGNINEGMINEAIGLFKNIPKGGRSFEVNIPKEVKKPLLRRKTYRSDDIGVKQDHASLLLETNTPRNLQEEYLLPMSTGLLSSLLFEQLREEMGLCYGVDVNIEENMDFVENYISLNLNESRLKEAEDKIFEIIKEIEDGKHEERYEQEKRIIIDTIKARERTANYIIGTTSTFLIYDNKIRSLKEIIRGREKVTYKDVANHISKTFKKENLYIETILP